MGLCLKYITFDPNYNYDNEEEEEEERMETENGEDEEQGACLWGWLCSAEHWLTFLPFLCAVPLSDVSFKICVQAVVLNGLFQFTNGDNVAVGAKFQQQFWTW